MTFFYGLILAFFMLNPASAAVPKLNTYCGFLSNEQKCGSPSELVAMAQAGSNPDYCPTTGEYLPFTVYYQQHTSSISLLASRGGCAPYAAPAPSHLGYFYLRGTSCPANSTQNSVGTCDCSAGYSEEQNQCVPKQDDPCELLADMCSGSQGKTSAFSLSGKKTGVSFTCMSPLSFGGDSLPGCNKGCMAQVGGFTTSFQSDDGNWVTQGTAKYSGSTCDPSVINDLNSEADPEYEPEENPETSNTPDPSCPNGFKDTADSNVKCNTLEFNG